MSEEEKATRKAVREYLAALDANKPKRGRKRTAESIDKRLVAIEAELADASPLKRLELAQERLDLVTERDRMAESVDPAAVEAEFVKHAKAYGEARGITYAAWREVGVSGETLKSAGVTRGS